MMIRWHVICHYECLSNVFTDPYSVITLFVFPEREISVSKINVFLVAILTMVGLVYFSVYSTDDFRIFDEQVISDIQDYQNGSLTTVNANPGGAAIPYTFTSQMANTTSVDFEVTCSFLTYASATLGMTEGGTVTFTYNGTGSVAAPPANSPPSAANYDVVFLGYQLEARHHNKWQYMLMNGRVWNGERREFAERWGLATPLYTMKSSQANYGQNNYPRPNPWVGHTAWIKKTPTTSTLEAEIGIVTITADTPRNFS